MATAPKLDQALRNAGRRYDVVVLDLARLSFIDSSGIGTIFRTAQRAGEGLFAFTIKPGSPAIMRTPRGPGADGSAPDSRLEPLTSSAGPGVKTGGPTGATGGSVARG